MYGHGYMQQRVHDRNANGLRLGVVSGGNGVSLEILRGGMPIMDLQFIEYVMDVVLDR